MGDADDVDEELDPRIKHELEKLNAATDGINHLETEFGEAQVLFQQMMDHATSNLRSMHKKLGKCVDKSRPYYEALRQAKQAHFNLHQAALAFERSQSSQFVAKRHAADAEKRAFSSNDSRLDPALQELLNQATIEVMEASRCADEARERHRAASQDFDEKQVAVKEMHKALEKHVDKSRPYFEMKINLNRQLEMQKERLEKIQEGIQVSKEAYSDTLRNLELISDDIHRLRRERRIAEFEPRGQGVGAESEDEDCDNNCIPHDKTMTRLRAVTLDDMSDTLSNYDGVSSSSSESDSPACDRRRRDKDVLAPQLSRERSSDDPLYAVDDASPGVQSLATEGVVANMCRDVSSVENALIVPQVEVNVEATVVSIVEDPADSYDVIPLEDINAEPPTPDLLEPEFLEAMSRRNTLPSRLEVGVPSRVRSCEKLDKLSYNERVRDSLHAVIHPDCAESCSFFGADGASLPSDSSSALAKHRSRKLSRSSNMLHLDSVEDCPRMRRKRSQSHS